MNSTYYEDLDLDTTTPSGGDSSGTGGNTSSTSFHNTSFPSPADFFKTLTDWQKVQLQGLPIIGKKCLLNHWYNLTRFPISEPHCNATWDDIYCWPPTLAGHNVSRSCSEVMQNDPEIPNPEDVVGDAFRICSDDAMWEWDGWTNYNECIKSLEDISPINPLDPPDIYVLQSVRYILFIGSVLSFIFLVVALIIFFYFKSLRCDRITIQVHLMLSLAFRFLMLIVIAEPFVFHRKNNYRSVDWICKTVMASQLYGTVSSVFWMFVQGHYLHSRVTTNVFDKGTPFKIYVAFGWGSPVILILIWTYFMERSHPVHCWKGYGDLNYIWLILGPMIVALSVNLVFLANIMRILLTKIQLATVSSDSTQFRRAAKATVLLFPLLGVNNLCFLYNPGGKYEAAYMITNTFFQSTQGIMVATLYCFISNEVRDTIRRAYRRFSAKRSTAQGSTSASMRRSMRLSRQSSYWNPTLVTNSVVDPPSMTTSFSSSMMTRSNSLTSRLSTKFRSSSVTNGRVSTCAKSMKLLQQNGNLKHKVVEEEEETEASIRSETGGPERALTRPYVTVAYCCHKGDGCRLIGESIPADGKVTSDEESSEAAIQIMSQGYGQTFPPPELDSPTTSKIISEEFMLPKYHVVSNGGSCSSREGSERRKKKGRSNNNNVNSESLIGGSLGNLRPHYV